MEGSEPLAFDAAVSNNLRMPPCLVFCVASNVASCAVCSQSIFHDGARLAICRKCGERYLCRRQSPIPS